MSVPLKALVTQIAQFVTNWPGRILGQYKENVNRKMVQRKSRQKWFSCKESLGQF